MLAAGTDALLIELDGLDETLALYKSIIEANLDGLVDVIPAACTVLVSVDTNTLSVEALGRAVESLPPPAGLETHTSELRIHVTYDGPDLTQVCSILGLDRAGFARWHVALDWRVAFCGFAPGFGYMVSDDHQVSLPRLDSPRPRVPAGAVAMAGPFTGIYPTNSPGGWQIVGHTDAVLFDLTQDPPCELVPGRPVRFVDTGADGGRPRAPRS